MCPLDLNQSFDHVLELPTVSSRITRFRGNSFRGKKTNNRVGFLKCKTSFFYELLERPDGPNKRTSR